MEITTYLPTFSQTDMFEASQPFMCTRPPEREYPHIRKSWSSRKTVFKKRARCGRQKSVLGLVLEHVMRRPSARTYGTRVFLCGARVPNGNSKGFACRGVYMHVSRCKGMHEQESGKHMRIRVGDTYAL